MTGRPVGPGDDLSSAPAFSTRHGHRGRERWRTGIQYDQKPMNKGFSRPQTTSPVKVVLARSVVCATFIPVPYGCGTVVTGVNQRGSITHAAVLVPANQDPVTNRSPQRLRARAGRQKRTSALDRVRPGHEWDSCRGDVPLDSLPSSKAAQRVPSCLDEFVNPRNARPSETRMTR